MDLMYTCVHIRGSSVWQISKNGFCRSDLRSKMCSLKYFPHKFTTLGPPSESDPFIRHHHSTFDPQGVVHIQRSRNREKGSKESISSSWSSLFNGLPGTSSGTVSIRPNSVAVSNLSSSGSGHDYAAKVAFIGNKYRNNKP